MIGESCQSMYSVIICNYTDRDEEVVYYASSVDPAQAESLWQNYTQYHSECELEYVSPFDFIPEEEVKYGIY